MLQSGFAHAALILVVIVAGIGAVLFFSSQGGSIPVINRTVVDECFKEPEIIKGLAFFYPRDDCYLNKAVEMQDEEFCYKISQNDLRIVECRYRVAAAKELPELCEKIDKDIQRNIYKNNCYTTIAINTKDVNICLLIDDRVMKDSCILGVGKQTLNPNVCNMISSSSAFRQECLDFVEDNSS